jgi:predicted RNA-binding protein with PUA-like domain
MAYWLLKTEPNDFSYDDLEKEGTTIWDGVTNNWALKHIRNIKKGDEVLIYHTGKEKRIVGKGVVVSNPYADPQKEDPNLVVVDVSAQKRLSGDITLKMLKQDPFFSDFLLIKFTRLSVIPVKKKHWSKIFKLEQKND